MSFTTAGILGSLGLQNSQLGQGLIGLQEQQGKVTTQLYVYGTLFTALVFGIITVILFSTNVSDLESYGDYFSSTGRKVGIGFAVATLITLVVTGFMMDSSLECTEITRGRATRALGGGSPQQMPNLIGTVSPYARQPSISPYQQQRPPQVVYRQQPTIARPRPPQPPPPNARVLQAAPISYPAVPTQSPVAYPVVPTASPTIASTFASALPGLINTAAPIALAAVNAPQGQRGLPQ